MIHAAALLCAALSSAHGVLAQQVKVPANFQVGAKWQIEIQSTLDDTKPLQPTDAVVWDLDLYHLARNPGVVTYLRVRLSVIPFQSLEKTLKTGKEKQP